MTPQETKYRVVTNGHEFKVQERIPRGWSWRYWWWSGESYWADYCGDNCDMGGNPCPVYYPHAATAWALADRLEKGDARYNGEWRPVQRVGGI